MPCDRSLICILASSSLLRRPPLNHKPWSRRMPNEAHHSREVRQGLFGRQPHKDRQEHPAVTCNINRKGAESEAISPSASLRQFVGSSDRFRGGSRVQTQSPRWPWPGPGPHLESLRRGIPSQQALQLPTRMKPDHARSMPLFSGSPYPSGPPICLRSCAPRVVGLLMPKTSSPCHNGKSPNRRLSRAPVGACGSKRVSLTLAAHRAYSANWLVISDLIQTLYLYASHGAPSSSLLIYYSMPCGEERPCSASRPDVGPGLRGVPQL